VFLKHVLSHHYYSFKNFYLAVYEIPFKASSCTTTGMLIIFYDRLLIQVVCQTFIFSGLHENAGISMCGRVLGSPRCIFDG